MFGETEFSSLLGDKVQLSSNLVFSTAFLKSIYIFIDKEKHTNNLSAFFRP